MPNTRIPIQKRSIDKKKKIIEKGFYLMCEKGYYNVNTSDIAKYSNVSTGIVYQYFKNKKEIFIEGVKDYYKKIADPTINILEKEKISINNIDKIIKKVIKECLNSHTISKTSHQNLMAMTHLDEDISNIFKEYEINLTNKIDTLLKDNNIIVKNSKEKIHIIIGIVDNFCHEVVYHKHDKLNYNNMEKVVTNIIIYTLTSSN